MIGAARNAAHASYQVRSCNARPRAASYLDDTSARGPNPARLPVVATVM
jgi:hypothetical protein